MICFVVARSGVFYTFMASSDILYFRSSISSTLLSFSSLGQIPYGFTKPL